MSKDKDKKNDEAVKKPTEVATEAEVVAPEVEEAEVTPEAPAVEERPEPSWDVETWMEVCKTRIGVERYALAGALRGRDKTIPYTEREIRRLVETFLNTPIRKRR